MMAIDFEAIRANYPLVQIVEQTVKLRKSGANKVGCCPFHPDKSPSFVVYQDGNYHCFGCGAHGDVIDYVATIKHFSTVEAVRFLTGDNTPVWSDEDRQRRDAERSQQDAEQRARQSRAIRDAGERWDRALPINGVGGGYLDRKQIAPYGCRREGENLIVPIVDADECILSVQSIPPEPGGKKLFHAGAPVSGGRYLLGDVHEGPIVVCEGFATGASIQAATGHLVAVAFSKGNLAAVAADLAARYPGRPVLIAADTDGVEQAQAAADGCKGRVVVPEMRGEQGTDFNDQALVHGLEDVAAIFRCAADAPLPSPLPLIWYDDIAPVLSGNWLIKNVVPAEAFVTIIGHPGCGKSFLALDMALHIATGEPWQGRKVRQGVVVYLAAEGQRGQQNRVEAWRRHHDLHGLPFAMIPVAINLRDREADLPKLIETIHIALARVGMNLAALVVDTLNRTFGGGDENGSDMSEYVENVGRLQAEFGCTAIVVHHIPKNSETVSERGHGSLRGAIETSLVISSDAETGQRTLLCKKQKDAEDGWKSMFRLQVIDLGQDEDGDAVTSCVVVHSEEDAAARPARGPNLSATQRQVYGELLAALEASPVSIPRDIPDDQIDRVRVGKVVSRSVWMARWMAIGGAGKSQESASATFRRAATDLHNKGLVGLWNDHAWATHQ